MAYTANKMTAQAARKMVDFDPDSGSEIIVDLLPGATGKCLPLSELGGIVGLLVGLIRTVGTGTVSTFRIFVSDDADGATNATVVASHALGSAPDAVGDTIWLHVLGEQIQAAKLSTSAYIGVKITLQTSTDECIVYVERNPHEKRDGLTADFIQ